MDDMTDGLLDTLYCELCGREVDEWDAEFIDENGHECVYCESCWDFRRENGYAREPWEEAGEDENDPENGEEE